MNKLCKATLILVLVLTLSACYSNNQDTETDKKVEVVEKISLKYIKILSVEDQIYTGKEIKPTQDLKYKGKTLVEGNDYILSYSNNIDIGTAKMTITGIGDYEGTIIIRFKIVEDKNNDSNSK